MLCVVHNRRKNIFILHSATRLQEDSFLFMYFTILAMQYCIYLMEATIIQFLVKTCSGFSYFHLFLGLQHCFYMWIYNYKLAWGSCRPAFYSDGIFPFTHIYRFYCEQKISEAPLDVLILLLSIHIQNLTACRNFTSVALNWIGSFCIRTQTCTKFHRHIAVPVLL